MNSIQPFGLAVIVLGAVLLGFGYHFSEAPLDQISNTLTGHYTDKTMWYVLAGIGMVVTGGVLAVFGKRV